ncbi:MAG: nucleotidyltransferase domain-containing protein [Candidatus Aenigmarchaeota archaeon]|nr:nucleotidyltransferase domain-containing protein [Candidatus Aenigmarchaeota archaeon]
MKRESLISYAMNFASFLLDEKFAKNIDRIILFGSVARGELGKESDIDLFVDTGKNIDSDVQKTLSMFRKSETQKKWELKGLRSELSVKVGKLEKWKLRRSVISDGIIIYGKCKDIPEKAEYYVLLKPSFSKFKKSRQVKLWRKLYGYKQKVGKKTYKTEGLTEKLGGKRIESGILIPAKNRKEILDLFSKEKIKYTVDEIWSDTI